jgi:predicted GH43/DUF377 family glycosyl hydrolase/glycosyltransferase involved in cell wall biosynthesis
MSVGVRGQRSASIALCMIVRDEAQILERCLRSLDGLIDSWVICDTGSSDGTPELASSLLGHLPGQLHMRAWIDFGNNRSELLALARGTADYLLLLDADMTVRREGPLPQLTADAYLLREVGGLDFGVVRLVRGDRSWWYEGSTHEHIATDGEISCEELRELQVEHHGDGSARPEKLLRDAGLLKRDVRNEPENPRPVFYLAQTYRDLGKHALAAKYYRRRVDMGGWDEEVFYANLQEGILTIRQDLSRGVALLLEAWQRRPGRAEPLFELAQAYREREDFALARLFAERGLEVPYPADVLFIHKGVYDYGLLIERALACGGLGEVEQTRADLQEVLGVADLPTETRSYVERCLGELHHGPSSITSTDAPIASARDRSTRRRPNGAARLAALAPSVKIGEIKLDVKPDWPSFNPSIAADHDGFRMIVRTANYQIERGVLHAEGVLHNINYLVKLNSGLGVTDIDPIIDRSGRSPSQHTQIVGYEDCRLMRVHDHWYASATVCDMNPVDRREIALLSFDGPEIVRVRGLTGAEPERHEKNWMPLVIDGHLHFLYSSSPTVLLRCDVATARTTVVAESDAPVARGFRGGSQGVEVPDGYLFVIHETERDGQALRYLHRFILLDRALRLSALTPRFTFTGDRVEFCAGMAARGRELVLSFGVSDAAAGLATLRMDEVLGLLEPPTPATAAS